MAASFAWVSASSRSCFSRASTSDLGHERHAVHHVLGPLGTQVFEDVSAVEDAGEGVIVLLRDRVELVVVTAGATERQAEERLAHGVDLVVHHVADDLLLVGVAAVPDAVGK